MDTIFGLPILLAVYLGITAVMSIITFLTFGIDKLRSKMGIRIGDFKLTMRRIPEDTLLTMSLLGGSLGALLGMLIFRHKTRHFRFRVRVPVHLFVWVLIGLAVIEFGPQITSYIIDIK